MFSKGGSDANWGSTHSEDFGHAGPRDARDEEHVRRGTRDPEEVEVAVARGAGAVGAEYAVRGLVVVLGLMASATPLRKR